MNGDELILRIVPELDPDALAEVTSQVNNIPTTTTVGGKGRGSDPEASARKQRLADIRAEIDANDLALRRFVANSQRKQQLIQQEAALGKRSLQETAQLIAQEENLREEQVQATLQNYDMLRDRLQEFGTLEQDAINRRKQLFFASERAKNGFTTMSGSMTTLTSNTKSANIAFANFGRIVQDAPFGLLGISNNIDPLLNSFSQLKQETGGTGAALSAMGKQLLGPAGLIFLLGSALPTALLFLQKYLSDTKKEADSVTDAVKSLQDQISKGFAEAAAEQGIDELNAGLSVATFRLEEQQKALKELDKERVQFALTNDRLFEADRQRSRELVEQRNQILKNIEAEQRHVTSFETQIALLRERERSEAEYSNTSIGMAQRNAEQRRKDEAEQKAQQAAQERRLRDRAQAERGLSNIFDTELEQRIKAEQASVRDLLQNDQLRAQERIALQEYYNGIAARLTQEDADRRAQIEREAHDKRLAEEERFRQEQLRIAQQEEAGLLRMMRESNAIKDMMLADTTAIIRARGHELMAIDLELIAERKRIEQDYNQARSSGLIEAGLLDQAQANAIAEAEIAAERKKIQAITEMSNMAASAVIGGMSALFGQSKGIKAAEVAVQSITAAFEAFSGLQAKFPGPIGASLGSLAAAGIIAQGKKSIQQIYATKPGTNGGSSIGASSSAPTPSLPFVNDLGVAGQVAGTITPFGASMSPSISITANLDRQGLALAVRDGEADIATRQIPFAS